MHISSASFGHRSSSLRRATKTKLWTVKTTVTTFVRRMAGRKTKTSFTMPAEYQDRLRKRSSTQLSSPSARFRRSISSEQTAALDNLASASTPVSIPDLTVTHPTLRGRNTTYRVHTWNGPSTPKPLPECPPPVRFSHPVVSNVLLPRTPMTGTTMHTQAESLASPALATSAQRLLSPGITPRFGVFERAMESSNVLAGVCGKSESYVQFKNRLDNHSVRRNAIGIPPALPLSVMATRAGAMVQGSLPTLTPSSSFTDRELASSEGLETIGVQQQREDTLKQLESPVPFPVKKDQERSCNDRTSYARFGPATSLRDLTSAPYPMAPGRQTVPGPVRDRGLYLPWNPDYKRPWAPYEGTPYGDDDERSNNDDKADIVPSQLEKKSSKRPLDAKCPQTLDQAHVNPPSASPFSDHARHKEHYRRVESAVFSPQASTLHRSTQSCPYPISPRKSSMLPSRKTHCPYPFTPDQIPTESILPRDVRTTLPPSSSLFAMDGSRKLIKRKPVPDLRAASAAAAAGPRMSTTHSSHPPALPSPTPPTPPPKSPRHVNRFTALGSHPLSPNRRESLGVPEAIKLVENGYPVLDPARRDGKSGSTSNLADGAKSGGARAGEVRRRTTAALAWASVRFVGKTGIRMAKGRK